MKNCNRKEKDDGLSKIEDAMKEKAVSTSFSEVKRQTTDRRWQCVSGWLAATREW
jgi:hypothetical protein